MGTRVSSRDPALSSWGSSSSSSSPSLIIASPDYSTRPKGVHPRIHPTNSSKSLSTPSKKTVANLFDRRSGDEATSRRRGNGFLHASRSLQGDEEEEKRFMIAASAGVAQSPNSEDHAAKMTHIREKLRSGEERGNGARSTSTDARLARDESGVSSRSAPSSRSGATCNDSDSSSRQPSATPLPPLHTLTPMQRMALLDQTNISMKGPASPRSLQAHFAQNSPAEAQAIAARAVAMVVNSSRKGIVPLCADVANLLRINQALEKRVSLLQVENAALRSACRSGTSASPGASPGGSPGASPGASSEGEEVSASASIPSTNTESNDVSPPCCSHNDHQNAGPTPASRTDSALLPPTPPSSTSSASSSPMQTSPRISDLVNASSSPSRCRVADGAAAAANGTNRVVNVDVHPQPKSAATTTASVADSPPLHNVECDTKSEICDEFSGANECDKRGAENGDDDDDDDDDDADELKKRKAECQASASPPSTRANGVDCGAPDDVLFELAAANREIEALRRRLQELEMTHLARINPGLPNYSNNDVNDEIGDDRDDSNNDDGGNACVDYDVSSIRVKDHFDRGLDDVTSTTVLDPARLADSINSLVESAAMEVVATSTTPSPRRRPDRSSPAAVSPLRGCKCRSCLRVNLGDAAATASRAVPPSPCGLFLEIGDHVVARGDLTGHVAYMGHLDADRSASKSSSRSSLLRDSSSDEGRVESGDGVVKERDQVVGTSASLHVGLILDAPVGAHNGQLRGKRYFDCDEKYGVFVHLDDIQSVISSKKYDFAATKCDKNLKNETASTYSTLSTRTTGVSSPPDHVLASLSPNHLLCVSSPNDAPFDSATPATLSTTTTIKRDNEAVKRKAASASRPRDNTKQQIPASSSADPSTPSPQQPCDPESLAKYAESPSHAPSSAVSIKPLLVTSRVPPRRCTKINQTASRNPDEISFSDNDDDVGPRPTVRSLGEAIDHEKDDFDASSIVTTAKSTHIDNNADYKTESNDDDRYAKTGFNADNPNCYPSDAITVENEDDDYDDYNNNDDEEGDASSSLSRQQHQQRRNVASRRDHCLSRIDQVEIVERQQKQRQGVSSDAAKLNKFTKRSSSAAASIRSSFSSLVGLGSSSSSSSSSSSRGKSSPPPPPPSSATGVIASDAPTRSFRASVFKNPLPSLPIYPALGLKPPTAAAGDSSRANNDNNINVVSNGHSWRSSKKDGVDRSSMKPTSSRNGDNNNNNNNNDGSFTSSSPSIISRDGVKRPSAVRGSAASSSVVAAAAPPSPAIRVSWQDKTVAPPPKRTDIGDDADAIAAAAPAASVDSRGAAAPSGRVWTKTFEETRC